MLNNTNGDVSDTSNYRPIALVSIFSKILEHIIATRIEHLITTTSNQFGFMLILVLKDLLDFYHDHGSTMHVAFLDASKSFDRVNYATLFCKLSASDVPGVILRLLISSYSGQTCSTLWASISPLVFL